MDSRHPPGPPARRHNRAGKGRGGRRQQDPVRPHRRRVHQVLQPGHAHRGPGRTDRPLRPAGRADRRSRRRRRPEALPGLQPDPGGGAGLGPVAGDPRLRPPAGLRHRPGNGAGPGQQDQARPDRVRHRRRRRLRLDAPIAVSEGLREVLLDLNRAKTLRSGSRSSPASGPRTSPPTPRTPASPGPACPWASTRP